ncbi:DUF7694 domain-containing protein [Marinifilum flexuosum]|uniref:DUF7694 domain-containing protein n=1 Tax=Marinifilum flexuosum TaxID=1117708 RepID=A0A419X3P4_9BACT|nr:hypothetical protein [Marinifilum flexuosum]RKE02327.1 hypothetical protein BXY64_2415 [Marinifilum flexuosum]
MTRKHDRLRKKVGKNQMRYPQEAFAEVDVKALGDAPEWMTRAFRNNWYTVMINDNAQTDKGTAIRAMVQNHSDTPIRNHWAEMQNIKNKIFGEEAVAVEYYPAESEMVDDFNIYWMWVFPEGTLPVPINN